MIVGIDGVAASPQIGQHDDAALVEPELPWLRVVAAGRQRGVPNELPLRFRQRRIGVVAVPPGGADSLFVRRASTGVRGSKLPPPTATVAPPVAATIRNRRRP